jgi:branched-chain amino acid aminotransferase
MITPDTASGILHSITRDAIITMAKDFGMEVEERAVDRTELYTADEVFLSGTAAEITPIVEVDRFPVGTGEIGEWTARLDAKLLAVMRGQDADYPEWRTPVNVRSASRA